MKQQRAEESGRASTAAESGRHMKEYYCFLCILMTAGREMRERDGDGDREGALERGGEQVFFFFFPHQATPSICLSERKERQGWRDWWEEKMALFTLHQDNNER